MTFQTPQPSGRLDPTPPYLCPIRLDVLSLERVRELVDGRDLYIWGGAFVGQGIWQGLTRHGFKPAAFLDSSPRFRGLTLRGAPVYHPDEILKDPDRRKKAFIVSATGYWEDQIRESCLAAGLIPDRDFISCNDLVPIQPAIEISGVCNLYCQGCPRGNMAEKPPAGFMSAETYELVLDKLLAEVPFLGSVQLYIWGEPLLNRDLFKILRLTRARGVSSIISTNLNLKMDMAEFVAAGPAQVRLSASGWGPNYEKTHTGGRWEIFEANFRALAEARRQLDPDLGVELYYHLYRHNQGDDYQRLKEMAAEAGFVFRPIWGCLYPWDNIERLFRGQPLSPTAEKHQKLMITDLAEIQERARQSPEKPCALVRCFPIDWNLQVLGCGAWYLPRLGGSFLETPLADLVRAKMESDLCRRCAALAIHRVNFSFMADRAAED